MDHHMLDFCVCGTIYILPWLSPVMDYLTGRYHSKSKLQCIRNETFRCVPAGWSVWEPSGQLCASWLHCFLWSGGLTHDAAEKQPDRLQLPPALWFHLFYLCFKQPNEKMGRISINNSGLWRIWFINLAGKVWWGKQASGFKFSPK